MRFYLWYNIIKKKGKFMLEEIKELIIEQLDVEREEITLESSLLKI